MAGAVTVYSHITKDPEVCGGRACVDGTRIRVADIVCLKHLGQTPEQMLETYSSLNLAQVHAALSYYYEHSDEIDADLDADRQAADRMERDRIAFLQSRSTS